MNTSSGHSDPDNFSKALDPETICQDPGCLKMTSDRYRVLIEQVADGVFETDANGHFTFFNRALVQILGYPPDRIHQRSYRDFLDPQHAASASADFQHLSQTGRDGTNLIWVVVRPNGQRRILQISAGRVPETDGRKFGFRGIARDITEMHRAREALEASRRQARDQYLASRRLERRYRAFLKFLPEPVFVFNLDQTVSFLNPAFEKTFGWSLEETEGLLIPFVPESLKEATRQGFKRMLRDKVVHGVETQRLTKDGRLLDIVVDGAVFYDEDDRPAGQVLTLRDITRQKRTDRANQTLFRISTALHQYRRLDDLLETITRQVRSLMGVEGASVILVDEQRREFYFREAAYEDSETGRKIKEVRFPLDRGVAGQVYRTGEPVVIHDAAANPLIYRQVDEQSGQRTHDILDVPIFVQERMIGVFCVVNKKQGVFDQTDQELLSTVAAMAALPIENARIHEALKRSYEDVKELNRAKDRVIDHLSHELKTPLAVLSASLELLEKKRPDPGAGPGLTDRVLTRARRNLERLLAMQYEIEDILRHHRYRTRGLLRGLVGACTDLLESWGELEGAPLGDRLRQRIENLFGPSAAPAKRLHLDRFVAATVQRLEALHAQRHCEIHTTLAPTAPIRIPPDVLDKIVTGLVRNAIENTPDGSQIHLMVDAAAAGPQLLVQDFGVGITEANQRLIFESHMSARDSAQYATRKPYDFNAGGRGFDLLRMKIFSERYRFSIRIASQRCIHIPQDTDLCPGDVARCPHCQGLEDCLQSGGSTVRIVFPAADDGPAMTGSPAKALP